VTATFSENVPVTGTPQLPLVVGVTNRTANYTSGSGNTTLVFQYTIQAGETDADGISIGADVLALNSGTIRDAAGNNATLTHSAVSANSSYKVDTTAPTANFTKANDNVGTITGDFTSDNTTDDTALVLSGTNESGSSVKVYNSSTELGTATAESTTSWSYSATVNDGTTYQFNVRETDLAGNTSAATSNLAVTGDTTAPTVTFSPLDGASGVPRLNNITITFSELVRKATDHSDLIDSDLNSLITLKDDDNSGSNINKAATINSGKTIITINPNHSTHPSGRLPTWGYVYVAIGTTVEDYAGNAITADDATFRACKTGNVAPCSSP
jgi:hypothetical protein